MRFSKAILLLAPFVGVLPPAFGQQVSVEQVAERVIERENQEAQKLRQYSPVIETYIQDLRPDKDLGKVPVRDHYFLRKGFLNTVAGNEPPTEKKKKKHDDPGGFARLFSSSNGREGLLQMVFLDPGAFNRQHYELNFIRREFIGEVRCLVFDVSPRPNLEPGGFMGRIWVEDQDYTIVRFNGAYIPTTRLTGHDLHFDSWRMNAAPGLWAPALLYSEESEGHGLYGHVRFRAQSRLWGYDLGRGGRGEFIPLQNDSSTDLSQSESQRRLERGAEQTIVARLEAAGLLAPPGDVDKVLDTVVNNLEVSNGLDIQPEIECRVLLTTPLELFSIGHTIVISRGLLDVLPDEGSLATMLAYETAQVLLGQSADDQWTFNVQALFSTEDTFEHFSPRADPHAEDAAGQKAAQLLRKSPYKDKLASAGLFLRQLDGQAKVLPNLISPHLDNQALRGSDVMRSGPTSEPNGVERIVALPMGSRIKLDPWSDQVEMMKSKPIPLLLGQEKMPFELAPFIPYLTRKAITAGVAKGARKEE